MKGLIRRAKEILSLSRVQAILGIIAATLSIGGFLYGYLRPAKPPSGSPKSSSSNTSASTSSVSASTSTGRARSSSSPRT